MNIVNSNTRLLVDDILQILTIVTSLLLLKYLLQAMTLTLITQLLLLL